MKKITHILITLCLCSLLSSPLMAQVETIYEQLQSTHAIGVSVNTPSRQYGNQIVLAGTNRILRKLEFECYLTAATSSDVEIRFWSDCPAPDPAQAGGPGAQCGHGADLLATYTNSLSGLPVGVFNEVIIDIESPALDLGLDPDGIIHVTFSGPSELNISLGTTAPTIGNSNNRLSICGETDPNFENGCTGATIANYFEFKIDAVPVPGIDATINLDNNPFMPSTASLAVSDVYIGDANYFPTTSVTLSPTVFDCDEIGPNTVTMTITYPNGDQSTNEVTVTVQDVNPPLITGVSDVTVTASTGACSAVVDGPVGSPVGVDNCGNASSGWITPMQYGDDFPIGTTTIAYQATDFSGNQSIEYADITVLPNPAEMDSDSNGIIDICDDSDGDGLTYDVDLCPYNRDCSLNFKDRGGFISPTSDYVEVPHNEVFNLTDGDFALEAWVNISSDNDHKTFITKGGGLDAFTEYICTIYPSTAGSDGVLGLFLGAGNNGAQWQFSNSGVPLDTWTHLAVSVNNSGNNPVATFYINGVEDGVKTYTTINSASLYVDVNNTPFMIGTQGIDCLCNPFDGLIDDLAVWNKTITAADIAGSMAAPYVGTESGLVAYYNFNQGIACQENDPQLQLQDINGSHNGTLHNFDLAANSCESNWSVSENMGDCVAAFCIEDHDLSGSTTAGIDYNAENNIQSIQNITNPNDVDYNAGVDIDLLEGFEVDAGATFHAYIDGCESSTLWEYYQSGYSAADLIDSGISLQSLLDFGIGIQGILDAGVAPGDLIGRTYGGGIIFHIDASGAGLIAAMVDDGLVKWGCKGTDISGADGTAIGTGHQNTIDVEAGCTTTGIAADVCANLSLNGYTDWFLPSVDELTELYNTIGPGAPAPHTNIIGWPYATYWSSTELTANFANSVFSSGVTGNADKLINYRVRAIRAFDGGFQYQELLEAGVSPQELLDGGGVHKNCLMRE